MTLRNNKYPHNATFILTAAKVQLFFILAKFILHFYINWVLFGGCICPMKHLSLHHFRRKT